MARGELATADDVFSTNQGGNSVSQTKKGMPEMIAGRAHRDRYPQL
ncbi:hypothetical protein Rleg10DRAFT_3634 [Rhizobium leguminosarum bv. trifolii WSM2012]|nr:hypothetical protein Rleg10DRAFT_3634 [Rhizobium leguminosarum bv. trifolii WSM2012]